jgi:hypothetical protein
MDISVRIGQDFVEELEHDADDEKLNPAPMAALNYVPVAQLDRATAF